MRSKRLYTVNAVIVGWFLMELSRPLSMNFRISEDTRTLIHFLAFLVPFLLILYWGHKKTTGEGS
jgi:hypothetical protein